MSLDGTVRHVLDQDPHTGYDQLWIWLIAIYCVLHFGARVDDVAYNETRSAAIEAIRSGVSYVVRNDAVAIPAVPSELASANPRGPQLHTPADMPMLVPVILPANPLRDARAFLIDVIPTGTTSPVSTEIVTISTKSSSSPCGTWPARYGAKKRNSEAASSVTSIAADIDAPSTTYLVCEKTTRVACATVPKDCMLSSLKGPKYLGYCRIYRARLSPAGMPLNMPRVLFLGVKYFVALVAVYLGVRAFGSVVHWKRQQVCLL